MSNNRAWKDSWIKDMILKKYLIVREDGRIFRCVKSDAEGNLLSANYAPVKYQTHKNTGRVYFNVVWRGIKKSVLVNRVVCIRFHPNPNNLEQVNHIDGNKQNNSKDNLEWCSSSENEKHAHRTGLKTGRGSANSRAVLTADQVREIRASDKAPPELARIYGVGRSTIHNILARRTWTHI